MGSLCLQQIQIQNASRKILSHPYSPEPEPEYVGNRFQAKSKVAQTSSSQLLFSRFSHCSADQAEVGEPRLEAAGAGGSVKASG